ncbi:MAG TPA: acetyl-CoA carboxylase biotin carboxyl carrier protein subunit, partial [Mucilaginibacter sp.]|nr:acetyl-CoA carboxylase biotin carboxyl carrier protein subunit [Mucilaginibacter sp.]
MYTINVNGKTDYAVERKKDRLLVNDKEAKADIRQLGASMYHIISDLSSYNAEVINFDREAKTAEIKVNGNIYSVTAKDQYDILLDQLGMSSLNSAHISEVKAPMP